MLLKHLNTQQLPFWHKKKKGGGGGSTIFHKVPFLFNNLKCQI